jgi:hypothetical protein
MRTTVGSKALQHQGNAGGGSLARPEHPQHMADAAYFSISPHLPRVLLLSPGLGILLPWQGSGGGCAG